MPTSPQPKRILKAVLTALGALALLPALYLLGAIVGGLISAKAAWQEPVQGVRIFVRTNGVHTWILVPKVAAGIDWRRIARPEHIKDPRYARGDYIAVGYGNRDFYLNTPTWCDLSLRTAAAAAVCGGPSLVHVEHEYDPQPGEDQATILLSQEQYRKLAKHIVSSFDLTGSLSHPLLGRGYGPADVFYEARGSYNAYRTCNEWTGQGLRAAGVRTGIWTPLSQSIMLRLAN